MAIKVEENKEKRIYSYSDTLKEIGLYEPYDTLYKGFYFYVSKQLSVMIHHGDLVHINTIDPFYDDSKLDKCKEWVKSVW